MSEPWSDDPRSTEPKPFWITCPQCDGTAKAAGGDCPGCAVDELDGFPTGQILVRRV